MKNRKFILKITALALVLLMLLPMALSCKARAMAPNKLASTPVGTVGEYTVLYEEFYALANRYYHELSDYYGEDTEALRTAVWDKVNENIITNYAILKLCKSEGLDYDEEALADEVKSTIELEIENTFDGSRSEYIQSKDAQGFTDHYVRFVTGVDILYNRLDTQYKTLGVIPNDDDEIRQYIKENFVHTWHITIFVYSDDEYAEKLAKAEEALAILDDGGSMYNLIKGSYGIYNEGLVPDSLKGDTFGTYFPKGIMDPAYEAAAFSLNAGNHSKVVEGVSQDNNGKYTKCFYIIERLPTKDTEIEANFTTLSDMTSQAIIAQKMEAEKEDLTFVPNDYAKGLDVTALKAPGDIDNTLIIGISVCVLSIVGGVVAFIIIRNVRTKKFHQKNKLSKGNS